MPAGKEGTKEKGNLTFLHEVRNVNIHNGNKVVHEEEVIHGPKGLKFKFYHKEGDKIEKIVGVQKDDGSYVIITTTGEKRNESTMTREEVIKMLSKDKHLKFALDYIKTIKGGKRVSKKKSRKSKKQTGGKKRNSRKASKKASKKGSRKASRKWSRK